MTLIEGARLRLGDLVPKTSQELAQTDLGPAPPPGGERAFSKDELRRMIEDAGVDPASVKLPDSARVVRSARRLTAIEVSALARQKLEPNLPPGARLISVKSRRGAVTGTGARLTAVKLPKLPRRVGQVTVTATAELSDDGEIVGRLPLTVVLDLDEGATAPLVARGARIELVIEVGRTRVGASAVALADANAGETVSFKVESTKKVLRGRVESERRARVVSQ